GGYLDPDGEPFFPVGSMITREDVNGTINRYNIKEMDNRSDKRIKVIFGSKYIEKLFDEKIEEANVNGDYDSIADKSAWINNLQMLNNALESELEGLVSGQKRIKLLKRLEIVKSFLQSGNKPEWMVLNIIPVIPPDLRPMVMLDGGRYATSDLNDLYRRVINRNGRLKKMIELEAPDIIIRNEKRMLQEAVDALIDNGRFGRPVTGPNNRELKSLSNMLKGKQGRFRQNLLGKRVDYSGRSVIVVGPELRMYQCGLPKEMALELFKPFVMKKLVDTGKSTNIRNAKKRVERAENEVWDALEVVIKDHPVLLNRAPTLHRLGIQAFEPILVEGRAIKLHPLVCTAFNADFDGDQMAVHLPLSAEAQTEARFLMLAANNLLKPSDGRPVAVPTQDMVLGSYYLTLDKVGEKGEGKIFRDVNEALMAYQAGVITLHAAIKVRVSREIGGKTASKVINCTVGKLIFNEKIPQDLGYVTRTDSATQFDLEVDFLVTKKKLGQIIDRCIMVHGTTRASEVLDDIKALGFKYSTRAAITVSVFDATIPSEKPQILTAADRKVEELNKLYRKGFISSSEKSVEFEKIWKEATEKVTECLQKDIDRYNPINMMADSGARGSMDQIRQLAGMRGLINNTSGAVIEMPIRANYREGLNVLEYFISSRGARKGLADTALRTADSGYLTRRLVDVSQEVIIREEDCGSTVGIEISSIMNGSGTIETFEERLTGRFLLEDLRNPNTGEVIASKNKMLTADDAKKIVDAGITKVSIRTVLNCCAKHGVCAKCYGANLANGNLVAVGEAVGVIAAQSIGEPGTQLTMRTFHTGGIASAEDITQGLPRVEELFECRRSKKQAKLARTSGTVSIPSPKAVLITDADGNVEEYQIPYGYKTKPHTIYEGAHIEKGDPITEGTLYPADVLDILGVLAVQNYIITEVQKVYRLQGVNINDKHIEVIVSQMLKRVQVEDAGSSHLLPGAIIDKREADAENAIIEQKIQNGDVLARPVTVKPIIQGITKASSNSDSFLSAASFQETTRALTDAAIKGKSDYLRGLKENVIIGKLIPAGTGMDVYSRVDYRETKPDHKDGE
ncbi:MAG: DNA-directed RNA polymerase subunit beta', partial [Oscillospiraceae bacterium]|nr:DNA-directed RNA polymerase subunit beta' [Oscillospiraceae bacterium]